MTPRLPSPCEMRPPAIQSYRRPSTSPSTGTPPKSSKFVLDGARSIVCPPSTCTARTAPVDRMKRPRRVSLTPLGSRSLIAKTSASARSTLSRSPNCGVPAPAQTSPSTSTYGYLRLDPSITSRPRLGSSWPQSSAPRVCGCAVAGAVGAAKHSANAAPTPTASRRMTPIFPLARRTNPGPC